MRIRAFDYLGRNDALSKLVGRLLSRPCDFIARQQKCHRPDNQKTPIHKSAC